MQSPTRRALLSATLGGAALALTACSDGTPAPLGATAKPDPDAAVRRRAAAATTALIAAYDAAITAHPALAARLTPLRAQLLLHRAAFGGTAASPTPRATAPATPAAAVTALAAAERRTADTRIAALAGASPDLARLLASVAAAGAVHAQRLTGT